MLRGTSGVGVGVFGVGLVWGRCRDIYHRVGVGGQVGLGSGVLTSSPPTKSCDFRRFDSSRLLILRGGNSHVRRIL